MLNLKNYARESILHHVNPEHNFKNLIVRFKNEDFILSILFPLMIICFMAALYLISRFPFNVDPEIFNFIYIP